MSHLGRGGEDVALLPEGLGRAGGHGCLGRLAIGRAALARSRAAATPGTQEAEPGKHEDDAKHENTTADGNAHNCTR